MKSEILLEIPAQLQGKRCVDVASSATIAKMGRRIKLLVTNERGDIFCLQSVHVYFPQTAKKRPHPGKIGPTTAFSYCSSCLNDGLGIFQTSVYHLLENYRHIQLSSSDKGK